MPDSSERSLSPAVAVPIGALILGAVGRFLIGAGIVVLLFVVFQLWGTNIAEARAQNDLRSEFDDAFAEAQSRLADLTSTSTTIVDAGVTDTAPDALPAISTTSTLPGGFDPEILAYFFPADGDAVARIEIPSIGVDKIVVSGVQVADLRKGPGQYPGTAAVGTPGNTSIAGHRTTYGSPFARIDELQPGDEIHVTGVLGRFTYRVMPPEEAYPGHLDATDSQGAGHIIVRPAATWVLDEFSDNRVTLTACHPKLSSRQRIIVAAELVEAPVEAPEFDPEVIAAFIDTGSEEPSLPGEAQPGGAESSDQGDAFESDSQSALETTGPVADLDEGLNGEREAIPGAVTWMLAATAIWVAAGVLGRRLSPERSRRIAVRIAGLAPAAVCLWFSFEMIDRALPAG